MPERSERREAADRRAAMLPPLTDPAAVGRLINAHEQAPPRLGANLGLASTRELLEELEARGELYGGYDGRELRESARKLLGTTPARTGLAAAVLDYRTVDLDGPPVGTAAGWHEKRIMAEAGFFTSEGCVLGVCRHTRPQDALTCRAREERENA